MLEFPDKFIILFTHPPFKKTLMVIETILICGRDLYCYPKHFFSEVSPVLSFPSKYAHKCIYFQLSVLLSMYNYPIEIREI